MTLKNVNTIATMVLISENYQNKILTGEVPSEAMHHLRLSAADREAIQSAALKAKEFREVHGSDDDAIKIFGDTINAYLSNSRPERK